MRMIYNGYKLGQKKYSKYLDITKIDSNSCIPMYKRWIPFCSNI